MSSSAKKTADKDSPEKTSKKPVAMKVTRRIVGDTINALASIAMVPAKKAPPAWLIDDPPFPASDVLPTSGTLVHLPTLQTCPSTPAFFCDYCLDYTYDPD